MVKVVIELQVMDGIYVLYVDVAVDVGKGFSEEGVMLLGISDVDRIEFF